MKARRSQHKRRGAESDDRSHCRVLPQLAQLSTESVTRTIRHGPAQRPRTAMSASPNTRHSLGLRRRATVTLAASATLLTLGCAGLTDNSDGGEHREVTVMAASSLADAVESLDERFRDPAPPSGPRVTLVTAGSATLVAQLAAGAEADVLMTADQATINTAISQGLVRGAPVAIAANELVLATAAGNPADVRGLDDLARAELLVGLCAVEAPCGSLARRALNAAGVEPAADTLEQSVRSLTAKLELGELDTGLVYATDAQMAGLPTVDAPELHGHANSYYMASVSAEPAADVQAFLDAFTKPDGAGAEILLTHGFAAP